MTIPPELVFILFLLSAFVIFYELDRRGLELRLSSRTVLMTIHIHSPWKDPKIPPDAHVLLNRFGLTIYYREEE